MCFVSISIVNTRCTWCPCHPSRPANRIPHLGTGVQARRCFAGMIRSSGKIHLKKGNPGNCSNRFWWWVILSNQIPLILVLWYILIVVKVGKAWEDFCGICFRKSRGTRPGSSNLLWVITAIHQDRLGERIDLAMWMIFFVTEDEENYCFWTCIRLNWCPYLFEDVFFCAACHGTSQSEFCGLQASQPWPKVKARIGNHHRMFVETIIGNVGAFTPLVTNIAFENGHRNSWFTQ